MNIVFVWTLSDAIGAVFLALLVLGAAAWLACMAVFEFRVWLAGRAWRLKALSTEQYKRIVTGVAAWTFRTDANLSGVARNEGVSRATVYAIAQREGLIR